MLVKITTFSNCHAIFQVNAPTNMVQIRTASSPGLFLAYHVWRAMWKCYHILVKPEETQLAAGHPVLSLG